MKERPILFSTPLIPRVLDGSKDQTRRVLRHDSPTTASNPKWERCDERLWIGVDDEGTTIFARAPADAGDLLWVREAFTRQDYYDDPDNKRVWYRADYPNGLGEAVLPKWKPSIHMPRWASRITLEVLSVRVERVQEISEADAKAEGVVAEAPAGFCNKYGDGARSVFGALWDRINGKRASWASNPFVWVISFRRVEQARRQEATT